ncbi:MAG: phage virion morphogenesis protein [Chitinophagales bacterium]|nr:phage virion morphogenesis protein [Chitinophagales bacterium]
MANNTAKSIHRKILKDVRIKLKEEFDRNFERKAFFTKPWDTAKRNVKGSLMMRTGALRKSMTATEKGDDIIFSSSLPYASIHNEGGEITITTQMKKFFWAMYYKASGGITTLKDGSVSKTKRNQKLSQDAEYWKSLAFKKVGDKLKIPPRPFIGYAPEVKQFIEDILHDNLKDIDEYFRKTFKKK